MQADTLDLRIGNRRYPFELLLFGAVLFTHLFAAIVPLNSLMYWYPTDDAFYYFQVARHIVAGDGVTFDGINSANGFHPLWMLVSVAVFSLANVDRVLPLRILIVVMAGLNAATAVLLYRLLLRSIRPLAAALTAVLWAFTPSIHAVTTLRGMEAGIGAFSLVLLLTVLDAQERRGWRNLSWKNYLILGLTASLVLFSRLDNVFLVAVVGLWVVFRRGGLNRHLLAYLTGGVVIVFTAYFLRLGFTPEFPEYLPGLVVFLGISLAITLPVFWVTGLYRYAGEETIIQRLVRIMIAVGVSIILIGGIMLVFGWTGMIGNFPRSVILIYGGLLLAVLVCLSIVERMFGKNNIDEPALVGWNGFRQSLPTWITTAFAYALPLGILLIGYTAWNELSFGTFMPVSGQIKHWWGQMGDTIYGRPVQSFAGLFGLQSPGSGPWSLLWAPFNALTVSFLDKLPWAGLVIGVFVYLTVIVWRRGNIQSGLNRSLGLLFTAGLIQVLYYNGTYYVNLRPWYWVNQMMLIVMFWAVLGDAIIRWLEEMTRLRRAVRPAVGLIALTLFGLYCTYQFQLVPLSASARATYPDLAEAKALEKLTAPGSRIGMTGGGVVAYFIQDRTIVNLDGLMNSTGYFEAVKAGSGRDVVDSFGLDYVFGGEYILLHSNPYYFTLADRLVKMTNLGGGFVYQYIQPNPTEEEK